MLAISAALPRHYFSGKAECVTDPAFYGLQAGTSEYADRVHAILSGSKPSDFRYFFKSFEESAGETYLVVNLRNANHCFDARMLVEQWDKLEGMRRSSGVSYPEELYELKWEIADRTGRKEIIYRDMHRIID